MTQEEIDLVIGMAKEAMDNAITHLENELSKVRTGKASPAMFEGLLVDYYGSKSPVSQVASLKSVDARTIAIQPWEKSMLAPIERAIFEANLGVTPMNDGILIRITLPFLTEERRKDLVKQTGVLIEHAKVSVRNARRDAIEDIKKAVKDGYPEDMGKRSEDHVQKLTDEYTNKVEKLFALKEKDIMSI